MIIMALSDSRRIDFTSCCHQIIMEYKKRALQGEFAEIFKI